MFLKKHQAYSAYRRNLPTRVHTLNDVIWERAPRDYIMSAFTWPSNTGREPCWVDLHGKWTRLVRDLNIDNLRKM